MYKTHNMEAEKHAVNPNLYSSMTLPSRTRSGIRAIERIPIDKRRLTRNRIMDPGYSVLNAQGFKFKLADTDTTTEKYYYINLDPYDASPRTTQILDEVSPLLVNPAAFEPGAYYTYVTASIVGIDYKTRKTTTVLSSPPIQLYATRAINMYEFGTKHQQIFYRKAVQDEALFKSLRKVYSRIEYRLHAAGEIKCIDNKTLVFNFYSGTYKMAKRVKPRTTPHEEAIITNAMHKIAPAYTNILFQHSPFICSDVLPFTECEIKRLSKHNVHIFSFETERKCKDLRNRIFQYTIKTKTGPTYEEMHEMYLTIK